MALPLDITLYTRAPSFRLAGGITLAHALIDACPRSAPANVKKACKKLKGLTETAQAVLADRRREMSSSSEEDSRIVDREADASWGALRLRLRAYSMLPIERFPLAKRASELDTLLFGMEGLEFLKDDYFSQNATMGVILKQINDHKMQKDIDMIAGPEFLQQIRDVMLRYQSMVNDKLRRDNTSGPNLTEHVRALQAAIVEYATKVAAMVDDDEPESIRAAQSALRPIEAHREAAADRRSAAPATKTLETEGSAPEGPRES
jgi:hypothetical protein